MIRYAFILATLIIFSAACQAQQQQYFEGTVTYRFDLVSKRAGLDTALISKLLGRGTTLTFKNGNYHHVFNRGEIEFDTYRKTDNKFYFKKRGNDTIFWTNCAVMGEKIQQFEFTSNKAVVLGIHCDELVIHYAKRTKRQYYNADSLPIDPAWFKHYTSDGENLIDEKEKAIYLKNITEFPAFFIQETAIKITRKKIADKVFDLPANAILSEELGSRE